MKQAKLLLPTLAVHIRVPIQVPATLLLSFPDNIPDKAVAEDPTMQNSTELLPGCWLQQSQLATVVIWGTNQ